ncbi:hypothetical protein GCM10023336_42060 [Streptomyces similanensis]|uniref:Uncharacterized protein n=1 Tax=Streptomyces similanensis TaxID=1274988 RepID=A0ABP9KU82_9ACTN
MRRLGGPCTAHISSGAGTYEPPRRRYHDAERLLLALRGRSGIALRWDPQRDLHCESLEGPHSGCSGVLAAAGPAVLSGEGEVMPPGNAVHGVVDAVSFESAHQRVAFMGTCR